jgi:hypothetical protein
VLEAEKHPRLDVTSVAERIRGFQARYELDSIVIDGANKQAVEEMRRRHDLPLRAADKTGKSDFIEIVNGEFIHGNRDERSYRAFARLRSGSATNTPIAALPLRAVLTRSLPSLPERVLNRCPPLPPGDTPPCPPVPRSVCEQRENVRAGLASAQVSGVQGRNGARREQTPAAPC